MPGGSVVKPPENIRAAVARQIPELPLAHFDRIAAMYNVERDHRREPVADVKKALRAVGKHASKLHSALSNLSEEAGDQLFAIAVNRGRPALQQEAEFVLLMLGGAARDAVTELAKPRAGAPVRARRAMVLRLAALLEGVGRSAANGEASDLAFLVRSVLGAYGEAHSNIVKLISDALNATPTNQAD